jgi:pimeloyl-ACP methyl ester carboxylesterase
VVLEQLQQKVNADEPLTRRGRYLTITFLIEVGSVQWLVSIVEGKIASVKQGPFVMPSWSFALRAPLDEWQKFWSANPVPGSNDLMALIKRRALKSEGDLQPFMANLRYFKESLETLLCLHTAGSDGRQYRALMNHPEIIAQHRVIAFDMPWHGKSSPPAGWHDEEYQLTSAQYTTMILEIMTALQLDRPIVMGCSIGGRIALHLALEHPERFRTIIGLQAGAHVDPYYDLNFLHRPGRTKCAGERALGNAVALHAGRARHLQRRSVFLQAGRRYSRPRRPDRYQALPVVSAVGRI